MNSEKPQRAATSRSSLPPSFTPSGGRPTRPQRTPAIEVGSGENATTATPPPAASQAPVAPPSRRPVQRISGPNRVQGDAQPIPVQAHTPGANTPAAAGGPESFAPRSHSSRAHGSQAPRTSPPARSARPATPGARSRSAGNGSGSGAGGRPGGPRTPGNTSGIGTNGTPRRPRNKKRIAAFVAGGLVLAMIAWPVGLIIWANGKLNRVEALSGAASTAGETYLLAGSDSREGTDIGGEAPGARTDTIMLLHVPDSGPTALISLPRDIYVAIPGEQSSKINAAYSWGGAPLLVETVEELSGLTVDHYIEVGFAGVQGLVDAVGGVELCLDYDVKDKESRLDWKAGCHPADGDKALAFARMRKADPLGDIGRAERQRQVVGAVSESLQSPGNLLNPMTQTSLINAGTGAIVVDESSGIIDLGKLALAFRNANSDKGITGTPPIESLDYRPGGVGSAVKLDDAGTSQFFKDIADGSLEPGEYNGLN